MEQCCECRREIKYAASVSFRTGSTTRIMCAVCAAIESAKTVEYHHPDLGNSLWPLSGPCVTCGRMIYRERGVAAYIVMARTRGWTVNAGGLTCTPDCNRRAHLDQRKTARQAARKIRACPACGGEFIPRRDDAVTCSNKCRQALFRRKRIVRDVSEELHV